MRMRDCVCVVAVFCVATLVYAQDGSTGAIRGAVADVGGARIARADVAVTNEATGIVHQVATSEAGVFSVQLLPPGDYTVRVQAAKMAAQVRRAVHVEIGGAVELEFRLGVAGTQQEITVAGGAPLVETQPAAISSVLDERALADLPLNGRRFTDLALLAPGATTDPRGLTSTASGDLAFGGVRGLHTSFLVDGGDHNNTFFAQQRGRYRAPYQFSKEVVQEFRVSANTYGAELGRSGGAVVNVATKSGSNHTHGTGFYYLRDRSFNAQHAFSDVKPDDRQQQFGFTLGGPIRRNRAFYFGGFDQHIFHVPTVVRFWNGSAQMPAVVPLVVPQQRTYPQVSDYEASDQALVFAAADRLNRLGGTSRSELIGNTSFFKVDWSITPRHYLNVRVNTSRYWGTNNVFSDPASPVTTSAISENGREDVHTETVVAALSSALSHRATSHLRVQFSRDLQSSTANSLAILQKIDDISDGFGRSNILPRQTNEHRLHLADTLTLDGRRHNLKFGGDVALTWIRNFFPGMFGGEYIFDDTRVSTLTFQPQTYGMRISPLRAYAHGVPRYYIQNFGSAISHPDTHEYAIFAQDAIRVTNHWGVTLGVRYDLQTFRDGLASNPLWPQAGQVPHDTNNVAPRVGFAYSVGDERPLVIRGGYGWFYTRIPQMYNSSVETDNGADSMHLFWKNTQWASLYGFPQYPAPLVACPPAALTCTVPANVAANLNNPWIAPAAGGKLTGEVSAFAPNFQIPLVQQASLSLEREVAQRTALNVAYTYVHGEHLIRARDVNLPRPHLLQYPVYSEDGATFLGQYYAVESFADWYTSPGGTTACPYPPCILDVARPMPQLGAVNVYESAASSIYHGLTVAARRRMSNGIYFRVAYTFARATDDAQDALVVGRPSTVQNTYRPVAERGRSVTDQRHRLVLAWVAEPRPFHREHPLLKRIFNDWTLSGVVTVGSGRPVNARVAGDANGDANSSNDRLPGAARNAFTGPDYATTDLRIARKVFAGDRWRVELLAEAFNLFNRTNGRLDITDDGFGGTASKFNYDTQSIGAQKYPGYFSQKPGFLRTTNAYAPRQVQVGLRVGF